MKRLRDRVWMRGWADNDYRILALESLLIIAALILEFWPIQVDIGARLPAGIIVSLMGHSFLLFINRKRWRWALVTISFALNLMLLISRAGTFLLTTFILAIRINMVIRDSKLIRLSLLALNLLSGLALSAFRFQFLKNQYPEGINVLMSRTPAFVGFYIIAFTGLTLLSELLMTEKELRIKLATAYDKLSVYSKTIEELSVQYERRKISQEIHDSVGFYITAVRLKIGQAIQSLKTDPDPVPQLLQEAEELVQDLHTEMHQSVAAWSQAQSEPIQVEAGIRHLCETFLGSTGISVELNLRLNPHFSITALISNSLLRVTQESLNNIAKHAQATQVWVSLTAQNEEIFLQIRDNGQGFDWDSSLSKGFGLRTMMERIQLVGGEIKIHSQPQKGTTLEVNISAWGTYNSPSSTV